MPDQMLVAQCAPTLAGIKTANLFPYRYGSKRELWEEIRRINRLLGQCGIRMVPVRVCAEFALLYLYRPAKLKEDLQDTKARQLLRRFGYTQTDCVRCIRHLIERFRDDRAFPHEIGLFLGYPPEDVQGFVEHHGEGCKCVGCWKVYGDPKAAQQCFESYKRCTSAYQMRLQSGIPLTQLAVHLPRSSDPLSGSQKREGKTDRPH